MDARQAPRGEGRAYDSVRRKVGHAGVGAQKVLVEREAAVDASRRRA